MKKIYISTSDLPAVFGKSQDWFRNRIGTMFVIGEHVFQPEAKGGLFWDIDAVDTCIRTSKTTHTHPDSQSKHATLINNLLK